MWDGERGSGMGRLGIDVKGEGNAEGKREGGSPCEHMRPHKARWQLEASGKHGTSFTCCDCASNEFGGVGTKAMHTRHSAFGWVALQSLVGGGSETFL